MAARRIRKGWSLGGCSLGQGAPVANKREMRLSTQHNPLRLAAALIASALLSALFALPTAAQTASAASGLAHLEAVAPVAPCASLQSADLSPIVGAQTTIASAKEDRVGRALYCLVKGTIAPEIRFEARLPTSGWTQRFLQLGCGGLCGHLDIRVERDEGCAPAQNSELVLASTDMGHEGANLGDGSFGKDPQKRIDFAYRGVHLTAVVTKALIEKYYGRKPRYSYFSGCSDGGREALMEVERFPNDFDGVAAGAPAMNFQVQNSFYHAWQYVSNRDAAGKAILLAGRLPLLHKVVLDECDALDGVRDGLISDPRACHPKLTEAQCKPGQDTAGCLTAEEIAVALKFYAGPHDAAGHRFTIGGPQPGSELAWQGVYVPNAPDQDVMSRGSSLETIKYVAFETNPPETYTLADFRFDQATFEKLAAFHRLYDATDTDLSGFQSRGGKLILWHGWSDPHISPINTIAFYQGVLGQLGADKAASTLRLFLFPGLYHCGGGDGFSAFDVLSPLMAWVESGQAPDRIVAGQPAFDRPPMMGPPPGDHDGPPPADMGPPPPAPIKAERPIFAYPQVARYAGTGEVSRPENWIAAQPSTPEPTSYDWEGANFMKPDFHLEYTVKDGAAVPVTKK